MHATAPAVPRRYVPGPHGQVHLYDSGGEGVPLLMLHQSPTSSLDWAATFPAFARAGQRIIAMDTPGMGMSDAPAEPPVIADYAEAAFAVLEALGVERAHVIGHHTGAQIAAELAAAHPDRVDRLILFGVAPTDAERLRGYWDNIVPREQEGRIHKPESGGAHLADQFARTEWFGGLETAQRLLLTGLMCGPKLWYGHNAALTHDLEPVLKRIKAKTLFLSNRGEMLHDDTAAAQALVPGSRLQTLNVEGNVACFDDPEEVVAAVMAFLREG